MTSVMTLEGKIRALQVLVADTTHVGFGKPELSWGDEQSPPQPTESVSSITTVVGYAKVNETGWMVLDALGSIVVDGQKYSISLTPTNIAYIKATIPYGIAEGLSNKIGVVGAFGDGVVTSPSNANWVDSSGIVDPGTLVRVRFLPVFIKPENTKIDWYLIYPLLT